MLSNSETNMPIPEQNVKPQRDGRLIGITGIPDISGYEIDPLVELTLPKIAEVIRMAKAPDKDHLPWLKLARFGNRTSAKGSHRFDANVIEVTGVEADNDKAPIGFDEAVAILGNAGIEALVYSTPSDSPDNPRWRVLCPFSGPLVPSERAPMMDRLNGVFGGIAWDACSWKLSQAFYYGGIDGKPVRVEIIDGDPIDLRGDIVSIPRPATTHEVEDCPAPEGFEEDQPRNITLAAVKLRKMVADGQVAHEDEDGDLMLGRAAIWCKRYGLSQERAIELIEEEYNPHCEPPWGGGAEDTETFNRIIEHVYENRDVTLGSHAEQPMEVVFAPYLARIRAEAIVAAYPDNPMLRQLADDLKPDPNRPVFSLVEDAESVETDYDYAADQRRMENAAWQIIDYAELAGLELPATEAAPQPKRRQEHQAKRSRFKGYSPIEGDELADLEYFDRFECLPRVPGGCYGTAVGAKGSQKSGIALKFGIDAVLEKGAHVLYVAGEGGHGIAHIRLRKHCEARGLKLADLEGKWITVPASPNITRPEDVAELVAEYRDFKPDIVFVDTLTRATGGVDINSPQAGSAVAEGASFLAEQFDATVVLIGHPPLSGRDTTLGSTLIPDHAYFNWTIKFDKGSNLVTVHLRNMKDGPDDFDVNFKRVMVAAEPRPVPAIVDCAPGEKPARPVKARSAREIEREQWRTAVADAIRVYNGEAHGHAGVSEIADIMMRDEGNDERENKRESTIRRLERGVRDKLKILAVCDASGAPVTSPIKFKTWDEIAHLGLGTPEL